MHGFVQCSRASNIEIRWDTCVIASIHSIAHSLFYHLHVTRFKYDFINLFSLFFIARRGRGVAGGLCASFFYITAFLVSKTWLNFQNLVELHGCFFLYGIVGCFGIQYLFINLPETEGKSLAEIERCFAKKCKT